MAATVPTYEPTIIQAGDTLRFTKSLADYSSADYSLTYVLISSLPSVQKISIVATTSGTDFLVSATAATTAEWTPGNYTIVGYVSDSTIRYEIYRGQITITPNIQSEELGYLDTRTYWEKIRDQLREVIQAGVIREVIRYSFNGVSTEVVTMNDAFKALAYVESKVKQEQNAGKMQKVLTRFVRPR